MQRRPTTGQTYIFDCDDVLLDWQSGFMRWMAAIKRRPLNPAGPQSWDMLDWVGADAYDLVAQFNESMTFGNLIYCDGARAAVRTLYEAGHELHVISSCSADPAVVGRRERNLDRMFGDVFTSIVCLPLGSSKVKAIEKIVDAAPSGTATWIEDNVQHALDGFMLGLNTFVVRRGHNARDEGDIGSHLTWIDNLAEIVPQPIMLWTAA